jgi:hypothetical protein
MKFLPAPLTVPPRHPLPKVGKLQEVPHFPQSASLDHELLAAPNSTKVQKVQMPTRMPRPIPRPQTSPALNVSRTSLEPLPKR